MSGMSTFNIERDGLQEIYYGSTTGVSVYLKIPANGLSVDVIDALSEKAFVLFNEAADANKVARAALEQKSDGQKIKAQENNL